MVSKPADRWRLAVGDQSGLPRGLRGRSGRHPALRFDQPPAAGVHAGALLVEVYSPLRNVALSIDTQSLYAQDHWAINSRWAADLGVRFEHVHSEATGGIVGINTQTIVPRLASSFDCKGNGQYVAHVTYGHYAGRNENQIAGNTNVGTANETIGVYVGPAGQGRSFCGRVRCQQLPHGGGRVPDRQRDARGGAFDAGGEGIHRLARRGRRARGLGVGHLCLPAHRESHRRLRLDRQRHAPTSSRTATISARSPTSCTRTATWRARRYQGLQFEGLYRVRRQLERQRALHRDACRTKATTKGKRRTSRGRLR